MPSLRVSLTNVVNKFVGYVEANISRQHLPPSIARSIRVSEIEGDEDQGDLTQHVYIGDDEAPARLFEYGGSGEPYEIHPKNADHLKFNWPDHDEPSDPELGSEGKLFMRFNGDGFLMNYVTHPGHPPDRDMKPFVKPAVESIKQDIISEFKGSVLVTIKERFFGRSETIK